MAATAAAASPAGAASLRDRTVPVTARADDGGTRPVMSANGRWVIFDAESTDLTTDPNGPIRDVFARDLRSGSTRLVSAAPGGADGPSGAAAVSSDGRTVVFASAATNLVEGDANGAPDVFLRHDTAPVVLLSAGATGAGAGPSFQPDVSADGVVVAFASGAPDLVAGDDNGRPDVFVHDRATGKVTLVSRALDGGSGDGVSGVPAVSPDGRFVSFTSEASDLVPGDDNGRADVFLADLRTGALEQVSLSDRDREQPPSAQPLAQASDVSRGGRYVAFDSEAPLVREDGNGWADVFVRDRVRGTTERVSMPFGPGEGNADSLAPSINASGRYVAFSSYAGNLFEGDVGREDVFVRDRRLQATSVMSVTSAGRRRPALSGSAPVSQRPSMSAGARVVAFGSTARLAGSDRDRAEDVYVRRAAPPRARLRIRNGVYRIRTDDRRARIFVCYVGRFAGRCGRTGPVPSRGRVLRVRATGPGMLLGRAARALIRR